LDEREWLAKKFQADWMLGSRSHQLSFARHFYDETQ
jgi:hypothetical protein